MTDMPAKIPRPIGSTEIFFPGIWKAAAALEDGVPEVLSAAGDVPLLPEDLVEVDGGAVVGGVLVTAGLGTEDTPMTDTPGPTELVDAGGGEEVEDRDVEAAVLVEGGSVCVVEAEAEDWTPGVTVHCFTTFTRDSPLFPVTGVNVTVHV